jgi:hypothetical protein
MIDPLACDEMKNYQLGIGKTKQILSMEKTTKLKGLKTKVHAKEFLHKFVWTYC